MMSIVFVYDKRFHKNTSQKKDSSVTTIVFPVFQHQVNNDEFQHPQNIQSYIPPEVVSEICLGGVFKKKQSSAETMIRWIPKDK